MKKFFGMLTVALVLTLIAAISVMPFQASAAVGEKSMDISNNVIFISDSAKTDGVVGDGSSPDRPLDPTPAAAHLIDEKTTDAGVKYGNYYYNTALYQAAEMLANTGGTIVICGDVLIDGSVCYGTASTQRDFIMPLSDKNLCITSVYDGVDYRSTKEGAAFILESPAQLTLNAPTIFEKILIHTNETTGRVICANANRLVMGEDITYPNDLDANKYISIAGGSRYTRLNGDTDITIKSGYYYTACGSSWGAGTSEYTNTGNITMTFEGGTFRQIVSAGVPGNSTHYIDGDVTINIYKGAQFGGAIAISGVAGFASEGNEVTVNVYGGKFYASTAKIIHAVKNLASSTNTVTGYKASKITVNLANASSSTITPRKSGNNPLPTVNELLNSFLTTTANTGIATQNFVYPAAWATSVSATSLPTASYVVENETVSSKGAVLNVNYTNPINSETYSATRSYTKTDLAFTSSCTTSKAGEATVKYKYGPLTYHTGTINVLNVPELNIVGARIKSEDKYYQGLKFVAYYTNEKLSDGVTVEDYGIIGIPTDLCPNSSALNLEDTYGMSIVASDKVTDVKTIGNRVHFAGVIASSLRPNQYNVGYFARAYMTLNYKGEIFNVYSDTIERNPYDIAKKAILNTELEDSLTISNLQTNVIEKFEGYNEETNYLSSTNLRTRVVNAMKAQMNLLWTPSANFWIYNEPDDPTHSGTVDVDLYFQKGRVYRGIPYTNRNFSQKETFSDFLVGETVTVKDKTYAGGTLDVTLVDGLIPGNKNFLTDFATKEQKATGQSNYISFPGSDCSTAVITSWNTVINNRSNLKNLYCTRYMVPNSNAGTVAVGDYDYSYEKYGADTKLMCADTANAAKIKKAYELLQPGDAIVSYSTAGHTRMIVENNVVFKEDGVQKVGVTTIECANWDIDSKTSEGFYIASWKKLNYSYDKLLSTGYIPITIPELVTGCSDSEYTYVTDLNLDEDLPEGKLTGKAVSNRQIISVDITVNDGTTTTSVAYRPKTTSKYTEVHVPMIDLSYVDMSKLNLQSGKTYTMNLNIRVAGLSDANPTVKLIKDYQFTVK